MKPTLLILAAGIGSRYGGLKQVDSMGKDGESILEFSVFDAIKAGFGKAVFVIRKDIEAAFREKVGRKIEPHIDVEYVFQEMETGLEWMAKPPHREKPWGTGHAILSAKNALKEPFAAINADDFYGPAAFKTLAQFLRQDCAPDNYAMVAYRLANTLSENGTVARGVCMVSEDGYLDDVTETLKIERFPDGIHYPAADGSRRFLADETLVSMNFWGFHHTILEKTEALFREFVQANMDNPKAEFYIPTIVNYHINHKLARIKVLSSDSQWYGVTYPEDKTTVQNALARMTEEGVYASPLWGGM